MKNKLSQYQHLLKLSYMEACNLLLNKYGESKYDYVINEDSYNKFLNDEIKNFIKHKEVSRAKSDGLYCHHIMEDKYYNLSNPHAIKNQKAPFSSQEKDNLVYCDLIEHVILHVLIYCFDNEKNIPFQIIKNIEDWYIKPHNKDWEPKEKYLIKCYIKSYLSSKDAKIIYNDIKNRMNA